MMKIPKEIKIILTIDKFNVDKEIILTRKGNQKNPIHHGSGSLNYIKWYEYQLPSDIGNYIEEINCYDNIALSFFRITPECKKNAEKNLINEGVSKINCHLPHVHTKYGNIHPGIEYVEQYGDKIYQLVLCKGLGPKLNIKNIYNETNPKKDNLYQTISQGLYVHKASYYPLIYDEEEIKEDVRYLFLSVIWDKLKEIGIVNNQ